MLKQINFGTVEGLKENQKINFLPISLEVAGSYAGFKNFILKLEKSARLVEVENTSFSYPEREQKEGYIFRLGLKVYSY
jgi:Tfp pilus assembly protein PilO